MARGWHGNSAGHARAGQLGGKKSAEVRRRNGVAASTNTTTTTDFGEQISSPRRRSRKQPSKPSASTKASAK